MKKWPERREGDREKRSAYKHIDLLSSKQEENNEPTEVRNKGVRARDLLRSERICRYTRRHIQKRDRRDPSFHGPMHEKNRKFEAKIFRSQGCKIPKREWTRRAFYEPRVSDFESRRRVYVVRSVRNDDADQKYQNHGHPEAPSAVAQRSDGMDTMGTDHVGRKK